jgi:uncharacterized membrane-anchored protein YjiN (DUF445 family)
MRWTATGLLAAMAVLFFTSHGPASAPGAHPAWGYLNAFAEAAMVGGLADWFAVTALFRHPLGLPIPHTAIIPSNKDRIADTMAGFLRRNFLTPSVVARRMAGMNIASAIGDFLVDSPDKDANDTRARITAGAAEMMAEILESLDPDRLGNQVRSGLASQIQKLEISPLAGRMLESMMTDKQHEPLINGFIRWAGLTLEDNEDTVKDVIHKRANAVLRWTGLDERISSNVLDGLYKLLAEVLVDPEHPIRYKIEEGLQKLAQDLQYDPETRDRVEAMKRDLVETLPLANGGWGSGSASAGRLSVARARPIRNWATTCARRWSIWAMRSNRICGCRCRSTGLPVAPQPAWRRVMAIRSSPSFPKPSSAGMRPRSPAGSRMLSGATCSSSASTARWLAGWLA